MKLVVLPARFQCETCGTRHDTWPEQPCCDEPGTPPPGLLTPDDVADLARVSKATVLRWINSGDLPALRDGRVIRVHPDVYDKFARNGGRHPTTVAG